MTLTKIVTELYGKLTVSFLAHYQFTDGVMSINPIDVNLFTITNTETGEATNLQCSADDLPYEYQPYASKLRHIQCAIVGGFNKAPESVFVKWGFI